MSDLVNCLFCGEEIQASEIQCTHCGRRLVNESEPEPIVLPEKITENPVLTTFMAIMVVLLLLNLLLTLLSIH